MGGLFGFIVGVIVGVIAAWWFFERRDAQSREAIEAGWKKKLDHTEAEVSRADAAHEETKERLRLLQQERQPVAADDKTAEQPASAPPPAPPASTPAKPLETARGEAERIARARRRIDAKLAQLPAGSSARKRLMAERAALERSKDAPTDRKSSPPDEPLFTPPAGSPDELEKIRGIGPVLKARLNELGITTFAQIAALTETDLARLDEVLDFKGRIARENWIEQAKALSESQ